MAAPAISSAEEGEVMHQLDFTRLSYVSGDQEELVESTDGLRAVPCMFEQTWRRS
jgi:hypothetical protein